MNVILCERGELGIQELPEMTDDQSAQVVHSVANFFRDFLDQQLWRSVNCFLSRRAENVLRYNEANTVGDVRRCLLKAQSSSKLAGAGVLVQTEWMRLLAAARTSA